MRTIIITESQLRHIQECINSINRADILNEEGEGGGAISADGGSGPIGGSGGATSTFSVNVQGSGAVPGGKTTKKKTIGGFQDKGDGFFGGAITKSAPITEKRKR